MSGRGYRRSGREPLDVTDEVTPNDRSRVRHERDDAHYVRRIGEPGGESIAADASVVPPVPPVPPTPRPAPRISPTPRARRRPGVVLLVTIVVVALAIAATAWWAVARSSTHAYGGRALYVNPDSSAAVAAEHGASEAEREAAARIAAQPVGIWLTPEKQPAGEVGELVRSTVAASLGDLPVFVVYGITDRDCGGQSAGGLEPAAYLSWVDEITEAMGDTPAIVVLEPDALALASECGDPAERAALVREALGYFHGNGPAVYLDGGHSKWLPVEQQAELLRAAGVDRARGFATNVSNSRTTAAERAYAGRLSAALGGTHAIIDTSRNGSGPPADDEWCNARGLTLGETPAAIDDPVVDAVLWIKPPGESDGRCNGGPAAGDWWPDAAIELAGLDDPAG